MENRSRSPRVSPIGLIVRLAGAALLLAAWMGPAAVAHAEAAPLVAQQGACGDRDCGEVPTDDSACGDVPCDQVPVDPGGACGDSPCGEVPPDQAGACGDVPCDQVAVDPAGACGGVPCGEVPAGDPNNPAAGGRQPDGGAPTTVGPAGPTVPGQDATGQEGFKDGQAAPLDTENTGSGGGSSLLIPLLIVGLAGVVLFWVVRRNRGAAEGDA